MRRLTKATALTPADVAMFVAAGLMVMSIRAALWMLPFARVRKIAAALGRTSQPASRRTSFRPGWGHATTSGDVCRAVIVVSRYVPRATCLTQALAAKALLERMGHSGRLCIGVGKNGAGIRAHAWLEDERGEVLIGHADLAQLARLAM